MTILELHLLDSPFDFALDTDSRVLYSPPSFPNLSQNRPSSSQATIPQSRIFASQVMCALRNTVQECIHRGSIGVRNLSFSSNVELSVTLTSGATFKKCPGVRDGSSDGSSVSGAYRVKDES